MLLAWIKGLDIYSSGTVNEAAFCKACEKVGYSRDPKKLFQTLIPEAGRPFISLKDFDTKAFNALSRGDFRMISEASEHAPNEKKPLEMTFNERQENGFFFKIQKSWDQAHRDEYSKACKLACPTKYAIDTVEEFEHLCTRNYGTIIGAWRNCLDRDGNGKLTFNEFCIACRILGYAGDLKALFRSYDRTKKGYILLKDIAPEADELVKSFLQLLAERYQTIDNAWRMGFHKDPHDSIDKDSLKEAVEAMGYEHDSEKLFNCLQPVPGRQLITIWDLDPVCKRKRARGDEATIASRPKSPTSHPGEHTHFGDLTCNDCEEKNPHNISVATTNTNFHTTSKTSFGSDVMESVSMTQVLRNCMRKKYGSTVAGWRAVVDPHTHDRLPYGKFNLMLDGMAFGGNVRTLWKELAGNPDGTLNSAVFFHTLDPDAQRVLNQAREQLLGNYGTLLKAWKEGYCTSGLGVFDEEGFVELSQKLGLAFKNPNRVFKLLRARHGQRSIICEDLEALLIGVPLPDRPQVWGGSREEGKERPKLVAGSARSHITKQHQDFHNQDKVINNLDDFKFMLKTKFVSLFASWRNFLDEDQNGVVTQKDFAISCRNLGVQSVLKLWSEFDTDDNGQISLLELDADMGAAFALFESELIAKYGSTKAGWNKVFNADGNVRCDKEKFVAQCQKVLQYSGDADQLYEMVRPEPGRGYLTYEDLWLNLNPNDFCVLKEGIEIRSPIGSPRSPKAKLAYTAGQNSIKVEEEEELPP